MGVLGDVISVGLNGPSVDESSKRWLGDVIIVDPNGPSVDESSMQLLGDVITEGPDGHSLGITEGPDGHSLGTSSVVIIYIGFIYVIYRHICGNVGEILIRLIGRRVKF